MLEKSVRNNSNKRRGKEKSTPKTPQISLQNKKLYSKYLLPEVIRDIFSREITPKVAGIVDVITEAYRATSSNFDQFTKICCSSELGREKKFRADLNFLWTDFLNHKPNIAAIVYFLRGIPCFDSLSENDQIVLLRRAGDVLVLRLCHYCARELKINSDTNSEMKEGKLLDGIKLLSKKMQLLNIDVSEIALLSAICVTCPDHKDLEEEEKVNKIQEFLLESLKIYSRSRRPDYPVIYPKLIMLLYHIRCISVIGNEL